MKKILTGIIALTALNFTVSAQEADNAAVEKANIERKQHGNRLNQKLLDQLDLTEVQRERIKTINLDFRTSMQDLIKSEMSAEERKAKRTQLESDRTNNILQVLTAEQAAKLKTLRSNDPRGGKDGDGEYKEKIKTEDGKTKIKVDDEKTKVKVKEN